MKAAIWALFISINASFTEMKSVLPPKARNRGTFSPSFPKEEVERSVRTWSPEDKWNIWEKSEQFEGDIMLDRDENLRNVKRDETWWWPNATIPYYIEEDHFRDEEIEIIENAMEEFHNRTCITFRQYEEEDEDYLSIESGNAGCWSFVGRIGGGQVLNLQRPGCVRHGVITHELLHALGFYHQQSAHNRDKYIEILWDNIKPGKEHNFQKRRSACVTSFGLPYDYGSIMHYSAYAFSRNGRPTIRTLQNAYIGQRKGLSNTDVKKLQIMYDCDETEEQEKEEKSLGEEEGVEKENEKSI